VAETLTLRKLHLCTLNLDEGCPYLVVVGNEYTVVAAFASIYDAVDFVLAKNYPVTTPVGVHHEPTCTWRPRPQEAAGRKPSWAKN
jgi:hypothetical protein